VVAGPAKALPQILGDVLQDGDLLLVMGAGDIGAVANELAVSGLQLEHRA
jgi:UDP-N-acetylmuramate--alanine ligase